MIQNHERKSNGKLLVAVLAIAMIIAGAAVVFSDSEVNATAPETDPFSGMYTGNCYSNGVFTVTQDTTITLTDNVGSAEEPLDMSFVISAGVTLTINGDGQYSLYITNIVSSTSDRHVVSLNGTLEDNGTTGTIALNDITAYFATDATIDAGNEHVINGISVSMTNSSLTLTQTGTYSSGVAYWNTNSPTLTMSASTLTLDNAGGISAKMDLSNNSSINVTNPKNGAAYITLDPGSSIVNSRINVPNTSNSAYGVQVQAATAEDATTTISNSNITITGDGIFQLQSGANLVAISSTIDATTINVRAISSGADVNATVTGGTFTGEFTADSDNANNLVLNNVGLSDATFGENVNLDSSSTVTISGQLGLSDTINADLTIDDGAYLTADLTIPEGRTLTISGNATLDMLNHDITIEGTLIIERNGVVTSSVTGGENGIVLTRTGSIQNNGILGDTNTVTITGDGVDGQSVSMKGVSGLSVSLARNGNNYYLAVSGDVSRISGMDAEIALNAVTVTDDMTIGRNVTATATNVIIGNNVVFTNNGTINAGAAFTLNNGASLVAIGSTPATITAATGQIDSEGDVTGESTVTLNDNVSGVTVSVGRVTVPATPQSYLEQRMYITGSADLVSSRSDSGLSGTGSITVGNGDTIFVTETLVVPEEITVSGTFDVTGGTIQSEVDLTGINEITFAYVGAMYQVQSTVNNVTDDTWYYTSFANAMDAIASAYNGEVTVSGKFTIDQDYTLDADQSILSDESLVTVGENATITINADASVASDAFISIEGRVIVNDGGSYRPATYQGEVIYEVMSSNKETGVTIYSGFKVTLDEAVSGDVIDVVKSADYEGNMTIPSGVTVNVADNATLAVTGNVTVEQEGALNLGSASTLQVGTAGKNNTINVAGTIDASEDGSIIPAPATQNPVANAANVDMYSTGTVVASNANNITVDVNSAYYVDNSETVYTSVANAAAYAAANTIGTIYATGTFSESGDVTMDGVGLELTGVANDVVTLGNITLNNGADITINDTNNGIRYSATVTALYGEGDAAVESTVSVTETSAEILTAITMNSSAQNVYGFTISAIRGDVRVSAGTVEFVGTAITINADDTLSVDSGATLVISNNTNISIDPSGITGVDYNDNLVNEGTILVQADITIGSDMVLGGDVTINDGGELIVGNNGQSGNDYQAYVLTITGTLTVSAEENNEGTLTLNGGALVVGEVPSMLGGTSSGAVVGQINMSGSAYVEVITGGSISDATFYYNGTTSESRSTAYTVNGTEFATLYTFANTMTSDVINEQIGTLGNLADIDASNPIVWYSGETDVGASPVVGNYAEVSTEVDYAGVNFTVSEGPGISIYIDDVDVSNLMVDGKVPLTIGEHTITVYVNAGYEGTPTITLNGTAISGTFEVTTDMINGNNVIYATGASPIDYNQGGSSSSDDGMGLTDYLLIILVVLIVIMAIMVAMRLMRS